MVQALLVLAAGNSASLAPTNKNINFDDLFPRESWFGKVATNRTWSPDGRYLAYNWNPYPEPGMDLWVFDTKTGQSKKLVGMDAMEPFDREINQARLRYRQERSEFEKALTLSDLEWRERGMKMREEQEARNRGGDRRPTFGTPSDVSWANKSHEFLFTYKGDIYRFKIGDKGPQRLTKTRDGESSPTFTNDDTGFYFSRSSSVYRVRFGSSDIEQLNPELPDGYSLGGYTMSPDEKAMFVTAGKSLPGGRQVDYIVYRDRFAQARKAERDVADDPFRWQSAAFYVDLDDSPANKTYDPKPEKLFEYKGGDDLIQLNSTSDMWTADSAKFTYATYQRNTKDVNIFVVDRKDRKPVSVYKTKQEGDENSGASIDPRVLPDGRIVCMLEATGNRSPWIIDPRTNSGREISSGGAQTIPVSITKDGKHIFVWSTAHHPARQQVYRVGVDDGKMERITQGEANYDNVAVSPNGDQVVATRFKWGTRQETFVVDVKAREEKAITSSHRPGFEERYVKQLPELFTYKNRHGHTIYGYITVPKDHKPGDKRPLFLYVYGGPLGTGKSVNDGDYNSTATSFAQYLSVEMGYITATIDPRGQSGYGSTFAKANFDKPGVPQTEDLVDAVKYIDATYGVDKTKVGLNGWSFGGFQTQMCMFTAPDVFTLGIAGAGPTEWQNYNNWYTGNTIARSPLGDPKVADQFSLTKVAKNLRNPLLLLHGVEDTNVLYQDTIKVYQQLLRYGKGPLVELSIDPTGGHGMGGDMSNRDRHLIYLAFLKKHWGSGN
jgi:dipeptidyl-peptidase-4